MAHINWHRRYNEDGYNIYGRNRDGFDRNGRDPEGFDENNRDRDGYTRNGRHIYEDDRESGDEDEDGFQVGRDGFNLNGYNRWGYDREGYDQNDRDEDDYDRDGYDRDGYNRDELDRNGRTRWDEYVDNRYMYRFDQNWDYIGDDGENESDESDESDGEREGEILSLNNKSGKIV